MMHLEPNLRTETEKSYTANSQISGQKVPEPCEDYSLLQPPNLNPIIITR